MLQSGQRACVVLAGAWLLGLAVAMSGCGDPDESADQARGLHGVVRNATTGDGVKGVSVTFRSDTLDEASDTTDGDGEYMILVATDSQKGRVEAKKAGYETGVVSVYFDEDDVAVDIELNPR